MYIEGERSKLRHASSGLWVLTTMLLIITALGLIAGWSISHHEKTNFGFVIVAPYVIIFGSAGISLLRRAIKARAELRDFDRRWPETT